MGSSDGGMGNGKRGIGKWKGKLILYCILFFRLNVFSEEGYFSTISTFSSKKKKLLGAKFEEIN